MVVNCTSPGFSGASFFLAVRGLLKSSSRSLALRSGLTFSEQQVKGELRALEILNDKVIFFFKWQELSRFENLDARKQGH